MTSYGVYPICLPDGCIEGRVILLQEEVTAHNIEHDPEIAQADCLFWKQ